MVTGGGSLGDDAVSLDDAKGDAGAGSVGDVAGVGTVDGSGGDAVHGDVVGGGGQVDVAGGAGDVVVLVDVARGYEGDVAGSGDGVIEGEVAFVTGEGYVDGAVGHIDSPAARYYLEVTVIGNGDVAGVAGLESVEHLVGSGGEDVGIVGRRNVRAGGDGRLDDVVDDGVQVDVGTGFDREVVSGEHGEAGRAIDATGWHVHADGGVGTGGGDGGVGYRDVARLGTGDKFDHVRRRWNRWFRGGRSWCRWRSTQMSPWSLVVSPSASKPEAMEIRSVA